MMEENAHNPKQFWKMVKKINHHLENVIPSSGKFKSAGDKVCYT